MTEKDWEHVNLLAIVLSLIALASSLGAAFSYWRH